MFGRADDNVRGPKLQLREAGLIAAAVSAFRGERLVLRNVALTLEPGQAALLLGANGAGKSTLLRVLAGLKRPEGGTVTWRGAPVDEPGADLAYLGHLDETAIAPLGLTALLAVPVRFLSAGQRRRVALAHLVGRAAGLWLLDEPTLGLDTASVEALGTLLAEHRARGGVVVAATHLPLPLPGAIDLRL